MAGANLQPILRIHQKAKENEQHTPIKKPELSSPEQEWWVEHSRKFRYKEKAFLAMKRWGIILALGFIALTASYLGWRWKQSEPRQLCLRALRNLHTALCNGDQARLLELINIPAAVPNRSAHEQAEFLTKALRDEISAEGLAVILRRGSFGPLTQIFPAEAEMWANQAGVKPEDCSAFRLKHNDQCAELVLTSLATNALIIRYNNVKQSASSAK